MLNARLVAIVAILFSVFSVATPGLIAQEGSTLPPGVQNVEVDGQAIDSAIAPVTNNPTPEFSGRTELAIPTIDLIVTGAEPIRFTVELDDRGRFRAAVPQPLADGQYTLAINDVPVGAFTVDSAAQETAQEDERASQSRPLLDIARMVPYPVDFGEALPGIGFLDGRFYTLDEEAIRTSAANGSDSEEGVRETRRGLTSAGWLQRYENRLAVPNAENPDVFDIQFSSFVVEYAFPEDASAAFASLTGDEPAAEFALVGEESALSMLTGVTPDTGAEYQAARLMFRVGPMLGMIVYADLLGQPPDLALLESVAQSAAARGAVVAERETVPLGSMALQLDPSSASGRPIQRDLYDVRAGALTALYGEDEATRESRVALFTGTTDAFSATTNGTFVADGGNRGDRDRQQDQDQQETPELEQVAGWRQDAAPTPTSVISIEGASQSDVAPAEPTPAIGVEGESPTPASVIMVEGETPVPAAATPPPAEASDEADDPDSEANAQQQLAQVFLTSALYAFPTEAEAGFWLDSQREGLVAGAAAGSGAFAEVPDAPTLGDASATFSTQRPIGAGEETANGFRFYSRVGAIVAVLEIGSNSELPLDNASRFMELQIECIEATGCPGLASLTGRFVGGVEIPARAAEPREQEESDRPGEPRPERAPRVREQQPEAPPVEEPPPAPIEEPTPIPVEEPTPIPIEEPTQPPVEEPTVPPVDEATPPPVDEGTPPPAEEPTPPPAEEPTPPPAEEPTPDPNQPPVEEPTPPVEEPTAPPAEEPTQPPAAEPTAIPTPAPDLDETPPEEDRDRRDDRDRDRDRDRRGNRD